MKNYVACLVLSLLFVPLTAEYYSGNTKNEARIVRAPIWVFLEGQPGVMSEGEGRDFTPPRQALQEVAEFLLSGLCYGWKFSYTPQDRSRAVEEVFELENISVDLIEKEDIKYKEVRVKYPYVSSWVEYSLRQDATSRHSSWEALKFKTIKGLGEGERKEEMEGVKKAYTNAIKMAILKHAKKTIKNRPKEIVGEVLLKHSPRLFCTSGLFKAEVELYINIREVIPYSTF